MSILRYAQGGLLALFFILFSYLTSLAAPPPPLSNLDVTVDILRLKTQGVILFVTMK
jgi:hypothetical protein